MKRFITVFILILLTIFVCFKFFLDPVIKSLIEKNLSRDTGRIVVLQSVATDFFKGSIQVRNIQLKNEKIFSRDNLITIPLLEIYFKINELFSKNLHFVKILVHNPLVNYDVIIKDGKIVDSFYLVQQALHKDNNKININNQKRSDDKKKNSKNELNKDPQIDFIIDRLIIPKINISVYAKDLQFEKNINLDQMVFENVGNTKNSNHYKDVMAAIVASVAIKINNEVIIQNLKNKFEKKLKKLMSFKNFKSLLGNDSDKIIKKLDELFR